MDDLNGAQPASQQPQESPMLPTWILLAAKPAIELKPAVSHWIKG